MEDLLSLQKRFPNVTKYMDINADVFWKMCSDPDWLNNKDSSKWTNNIIYCIGDVPPFKPRIFTIGTRDSLLKSLDTVCSKAKANYSIFNWCDVMSTKVDFLGTPIEGLKSPSKKYKENWRAVRLDIHPVDSGVTDEKWILTTSLEDFIRWLDGFTKLEEYAMTPTDMEIIQEDYVKLEGCIIGNDSIEFSLYFYEPDKPYEEQCYWENLIFCRELV